MGWLAGEKNSKQRERKKVGTKARDKQKEEE